MQINFYLIFTLKKVYNHIRYKDKEEIMNIQINILKFFQSIRNPILNAFFLILTISTEVPVIVILTAIMYWCINKKYGQKLTSYQQYPQSYQQLRTGFTQPKSQEFFERGESANDGFFGREL